MRARFRSIIPQICETFSFSETPSRRDQAVSMHTACGACHSAQRCREATNDLRVLERVYTPWIKVTMSEVSSSIVVRSEHQFSEDTRQRLSFRKHIYELNRTAGRANRTRWTDYVLDQNAIAAAIAAVRKQLERQGIAPDDIAIMERLLEKELAPLEGKVYEDGDNLGKAIRAACELPMGEKAILLFRKVLSNQASLPALRCLQITAADEFGEYLGFVDLRIVSEQRSLAMGLLAPPRRFKEDPEYHVMTGCYGPLFGAVPFPCTVYGMVDDKWSGAECAQACAAMALGMLSDRGALVRGPYTMTFLGKRPVSRVPPQPLSDTCLAHLPIFQGAFEVRGLFRRETARLLRSCGVSPDEANFEDNELGRHVIKQAHRIIEGYIRARYPIILPVEAGTWRGKAGGKPVGHGLVIVGYRWTDRANEKMTLIVHDPNEAPYMEVDSKRCFHAAFAYQRKLEDPPTLCRLRMLPVTDNSIDRHASDCLSWLAYGTVKSGLAAGDTDILEGPELLDQYIGGPNCDLALSLLHRDDLVDDVFTLDDPRRRELTTVLQRFPRSRYWCIVGFRGSSVSDVWLFDSSLRNRLSETFYHVIRGGTVARISPQLAQVDRPFVTAAGAGHQGSELPRHGEVELTPAVMTSSSTREFVDLVKEVATVSGVSTFDMMILRDRDIAELSSQDPDASTLIRTQYTRVLEWFVEKMRRAQNARPDLRISAFATYFPDITSADRRKREIAIEALAKTVLLAFEASDAIAGGVQRIISTPIVELVGGTVLDRCRCTGCEPVSRVLVAHRRKKLELLAASLKEVVDIVNGSAMCRGRRFALAMELEPGETYVLNHVRHIPELQSLLDKRGISKWVGYNMDIAHMRIAGIEPRQLLPLSHLFVHAHIADHPPLTHSRDQALGSWSPVHFDPGIFGGYLNVLEHRLKNLSEEQLPFSGAVAIELEGNDRMSWLHTSAALLKYLCRR